MGRYVLTPRAEADLFDLGQYIASESLELARRVVDDLEEAMRQLGSHPGLGHQRQDLASNDAYRFWPVHSFLIVYNGTTKPIQIVRVLRGSRDVRRLLD
ncbi:MAG TPA: type II toxin-antitoxin system RelE/ParE family toxin [Vicinamibacterales bacterium]|nr:type II toxin-antitoxin system RelE/ParE family toxin [Vicinamibacterales bacterium]